MFKLLQMQSHWVTDFFSSLDVYLLMSNSGLEVSGLTKTSKNIIIIAEIISMHWFRMKECRKW